MNQIKKRQIPKLVGVTRIAKKKKNETESWFFEKINKIYKLLERLIKKKRKQIHISKIRNERREIYN